MPPVVAALAAAAALAASVPQLGSGEVRVEADHLTCDATTGRCHLDGHVRLDRGQVSLRADHATYTPATSEVEATGDVLLVDAARVVSARAVRAVLGGAYEATDVVAWLKDGPVRLEDVEARGGAKVGRTRARLAGTSLSGAGEGPFHLEGARVTLCDCGEGAPSWEIRARSAEVVPGDRVDLSWPVLYVTPRFLFVDKPVPVLVFPWLQLPVSDRRTGLLVPTITSSGATGWTVNQPVFVTLGRSADLTLTPSYAFGASGGSAAKVRGPGLSAEARWTPAEGAAGRLDVAWMLDLDHETGTVGTSGSRVGIFGGYAQRISDRASTRVDLGLASDPLYVRDFDPERLGRAAFTRRSSALFSYRGEDAVGEAYAEYHLALAPDGQMAPAAQEALLADYGLVGGALPVFHRWPSAAATLLPLAAGPVLLSARLGVARFAPVSGFTSDSGTDGYGPGDRGWSGAEPAFAGFGGERDGTWNPGERLAVTRADARAEIALPLLLGGAVTLEPYVRGAALGYLWDAALDPAANAWGVAGAIASAELSRDFGGIRNLVVPAIEWRAGTAVAGPSPQVASYDGWDRLAIEAARAFVPGDPASPWLEPRRVLRAAPAGAFQQLRASLETRLASPKADLLRLAVGQDVDLRAGRLAETWATVVALLPPLVLDARASMDLADPRAPPVPSQAPNQLPRARSWLDAFTAFRANLSLVDHRGDSVGLGIIASGPSGSGSLVAGADALFDPQPAPVASFDPAQAVPTYGLTGASQGVLSARAVVGPATLGYAVQFPGRPAVGYCADGIRTLAPLAMQQQTALFTWNSPCRCFRATVQVSRDFCGVYAFKAEFDLSPRR